MKKIILLIIISLLFLSFKIETRKISFRDNNEQVIAYVIDGEKNIPTKKDKKYSWYKNRTIYTTQGNYSGSLLHGEYQKFYNSGNLKEIGTYKKGLKHGEWFYYNTAGDIEKMEKWKNGLIAKTKTKFADRVKNFSFKRHKTKSPDSLNIINDTLQKK